MPCRCGASTRPSCSAISPRGANWTAPYYRGTPTSPLDHAFRATDVVERFAAAAADYLAPAGHILLLLANTGDETAFLQTFRHHGYTAHPLAHRHLPGERITLWQMQPDS